MAPCSYTCKEPDKTLVTIRFAIVRVGGLLAAVVQGASLLSGEQYSAQRGNSRGGGISTTGDDNQFGFLFLPAHCAEAPTVQLK